MMSNLEYYSAMASYTATHVTDLSLIHIFWW